MPIDRNTWSGTITYQEKGSRDYHQNPGTNFEVIDVANLKLTIECRFDKGRGTIEVVDGTQKGNWAMYHQALINQQLVRVLDPGSHGTTDIEVSPTTVPATLVVDVGDTSFTARIDLLGPEPEWVGTQESRSVRYGASPYLYGWGVIGSVDPRHPTVFRDSLQTAKDIPWGNDEGLFNANISWNLYAYPPEMKRADEQVRNDAKKAAADASVEMQDAATIFGGGAAALGVVAAVLSASGVGVVGAVGVAAAAGALGVCSAVAWFLANRQQQLANDPARKDFHKIAKPKRAVSAKRGSSDIAIMRNLADHFCVFARAMEALVVSIERYDGSLAAKHSPAVTKAQRLQAMAIYRHASECAAFQRQLSTVVADANRAWRRLGVHKGSSSKLSVAATMRARRDVKARAKSELKQLQHRLKLRPAVGRQLAQHLADALDTPKPIKALPPHLFDSNWKTKMNKLGITLQSLADVYRPAPLKRAKTKH